MPALIAPLALLAAALLEAGGDAVVRTGLHIHSPLPRFGLILLGGVVLTAYGLLVNRPGWDFGRLLGVYAALFFLVAQAINLLAFQVCPTPPTLCGGALILAGGLLMTIWH